MFCSRESFDDLLREVFNRLLKDGEVVAGASRGETIELRGVLLEITNPLARLSRSEKRGKIFSAIGELLWYLSGSGQLAPIVYYIPQYVKESLDRETVPGAYGPRIFGEGANAQVNNAIALLKRRPASRRAVIQIFAATDLEATLQATQKEVKSPEVPCTCSLQFFVREGKVDLLVHMRSSDAYIGLAHDVFAFTMIQEIVARRLGYELGVYKHSIGSLHIYKELVADAQQYLDEGWQKPATMPVMPQADVELSISSLLDVEKRIRTGQDFKEQIDTLEGYWKDFAVLLVIFKNAKKKEIRDDVTSIDAALEFLQQQRKGLSTDAYDASLDDLADWLFQRKRRLNKK